AFAPRALGVPLSFLGQLRRARFALGQGLLSLAPDGIGLRLGVPDDLIRRRASILLKLVRVALRARDVLLGRSLREGEHLQSLLLDCTAWLRVQLLGFESDSVGITQCPSLLRQGLTLQFPRAALHPAVIQGRDLLSGTEFVRAAAPERRHASRLGGNCTRL